MLLTLPELNWKVRVKHWTWNYSFSHKGTVGTGTRGSVTWRDPVNGMHGSGFWNIVGEKMFIQWQGTDTKDVWDVPIFPKLTKGTVVWGDGETSSLSAQATNYYYRPGDVVYGIGVKIDRTNFTIASIIYDDEVRTGGTVAWITRNPGNIRDGSKFGAFPGKKLTIKGAGNYAIFPTAGMGLVAMVKLLKVYGRMTLHDAIYKYAPEKDGNNPKGYLEKVVKFTKYKEDVMINTLSDEQLARICDVMSGEVEIAQPGTTWARDSSDLLAVIRERLA